MEEIKTIGGHQLPRGADGGHYTPVVTQTAADTMTVEFQPSKAGMAAVEPVEIKLPVGSGDDSGQNLELDSTLTQSGKAADAKAVGDKLTELERKIQEGGGTADYPSLTNKPSINGVTLDGNKTAEELGITGMSDDQVRAALDDYIADNPGAITPGATAEQAETIRVVDNIGFTDPFGYCNIMDPATMIKSFAPGAGMVGKNFFADYTFTEGKAWNSIVFPVERGMTYAIVSASMTGKCDSQSAVAADGTILSYSVSALANVGQLHTGDGVSYQEVTVAEDFPEDAQYLWLKLPYGVNTVDFASLMVVRGGYANYKGYADYNPDFGRAYAERLAIQESNLSEAVRGKMNRGNTAIQADDLKATAYPWSTELPGTHHSSPVLNASGIGDFAALCNSARICAADNNHLKLNTIYAHCPTIEIIDGIVYAVAFQNASGNDYLKGATIELFRANITEWTVIDQTNVAAAGLACGVETLTDGCIDPNMLNIDNQTLRITFTTKFADGGHRMCYRDYDIATGTFGDIGLCKISDGTTSHDFDIPGVRATCGDFTAANPQIYMASQYAVYGGECYIALGVGAYKNAPILKTTDFATFTYWKTPVVDGNDMEYECALVACRTSGGSDFLYAATRQRKNANDEGNRKMLISRISLTDGTVLKSLWIPDGNIRPFWHIDGLTVFLWHTLDTDRNSGTITGFHINTLTPHNVGTVADTGPMIYATADVCGDELIVCYMRKGGLYISRIPKVNQYGYGDVIPMLEKFLDFFDTK